jgi:hypothetical protein
VVDEILVLHRTNYYLQHYNQYSSGIDGRGVVAHGRYNRLWDAHSRLTLLVHWMIERSVLRSRSFVQYSRRDANEFILVLVFVGLSGCVEHCVFVTNQGLANSFVVEAYNEDCYTYLCPLQLGEIL